MGKLNMNKNNISIRNDVISKEILNVCINLHKRNLLAAADGNVSVRLSDHEILITPSGVTKAFMSSADLATISIDNEVLQGNPSSERLMHLAIYKKCPQAKAIVHAHPPTAISWSLAFPNLEFLPYKSLPEVILATGKIPFVPYARPGTEAMGENLKVFLPEYRALILSRHGAVCWGETLEEAYRGIERIEHAALILKQAIDLCGSIANLEKSNLPDDEIAELFKLRIQLGSKLL